MPEHHFGWHPGLPDQRDRVYSAPLPILQTLPPSVDLRAKFPAVYDQGQLGCHDEATEVLTEDGWQPWLECDGSKALGTMNPITGALEFQLPTAMHSYEYDGPLHYSTHTSLDFAVTPNHRMYVRPWDERARTLSDQYRFQEAGRLGWYFGLPHATTGFAGTELGRLGVPGGREFVGDDFLALVALVVSDGWVGGTGNTKNRVSFCCFRADRYDMVAALAQRVGFAEQPGRKGVWVGYDAAMAEWFRQNAFTEPTYRSPFKRIPALVKTACQRQADLFLQFFGDQHVDQRTGCRQFYSSSQQMIDDLQEMLLRVGKRGSIYERSPRDTTMRDGRTIEASHCTTDLTLTERTCDRLSIDRKDHLTTERYRGQVFCATVPNSLLVTRRNGSVLVSGNSCVDNASAALLQFDQAKEGLALIMPSRLFLYYNARSLEGSTGQDAGSSVRDGIKAIAQYGFCPESEWPYNIGQFTVKPPQNCYDDAVLDIIADYASVVQSADQIRGALAAGKPVAFGFTVYSSLESQAVTQTGDVPMPRRTEQILGGHCVVLVGYDDATQMYSFRNSWGTSWGRAGYGRMPYTYVHSTSLASDFWVVNTIPGGVVPPPPPPPPPPQPPDGTTILIPLAGKYQWVSAG